MRIVYPAFHADSQYIDAGCQPNYAGSNEQCIFTDSVLHPIVFFFLIYRMPMLHPKQFCIGHIPVSGNGIGTFFVFHDGKNFFALWQLCQVAY